MNIRPAKESKSASAAVAEREAMKERIVLAALRHVAFEGWTERALRAGAADAGLGPDAGARLFPGGMLEVAEFYSHYADERMAAEMKRRDLESLRVRDRVALGVRLRIEPETRYREAIRRLLSFLALPGNAGVAAKLAWKTASAIWYAAGDTSVDWNYYTKRALLVPVYSTTVLYWLSDGSEGFENTWAYLDRRIDDVIGLFAAPKRVAKALGQFPSPVGPLKKAASEIGRQFGGRGPGGRTTCR